jgi:hypothetical protein
LGLTNDALDCLIGCSLPEKVIKNIQYGFEDDGQSHNEESEHLQSNFGQQTGSSQGAFCGKVFGSDATNAEAGIFLGEVGRNAFCGVDAGAFINTCKVLAVTRGRDREIEKSREVSITSKVERYTKTVVFRKIKFIADQEELGSLREKGSIGNIVMDYMSIHDRSIRYSWWVLYQDVVKKALDQQRSNCNIAIKEKVVGKTCGVLL